MKMRILRKLLLLLMLIIILVTLSACDSDSDSQQKVELDNDLKVEIAANAENYLKLQEQKLTPKPVIIQNLEDHISEITEASVTVNGETKIGALTDSYFFSHLAAGESYEVQVSLFGIMDGTEQELYSGIENVTVEKGVLTETIIDVYPLNAESLTVNIYDENGDPVSADLISKIELEHPSLTAAEYSASKMYQGATTFFENSSALQLIASYWHLKVVPQAAELEADYLEFLFLPKEAKELNLVLTNGGSQITINQISAPAAVSNLNLSGDLLSWTWSGTDSDQMDYFTILYAENLPLAADEYFIPLDKVAYSFGSSNYSCQLSSLKSGFYLVRAYNKDGYASRHSSIEYLN